MSNFSMIDCFNDFLTRGFYFFRAEEILSKVNLDDLFPKDFPNYFPEEGLQPPYPGPTPKHKAIFDYLTGALGEAYGFNKTEIHVCRYWTYGGSRIETWHNDACENDDTYDFALNCYFDDSSEDEGVLMYRLADDYESKSVQTHVPKKYDVAVLNHTRAFNHMVSPVTKPRRVLVITGKRLSECL